MGNVIENLLDILEKIENETNLSQDEMTKAFEKLCPSIENFGNDEGDVLDDILYNQLNNEKIKDNIFYLLDVLEKVFIESLNTKHEFMLNDLNFILRDNNELENEISIRSKIDVRNKRLFLVIKTFLKTKINELYAYSNVTPKADRIIKGKTKKSKKPEQIKAEEFAIDIWEKDPTITQENMAYQLKDKLELQQTIQTIIRWIRPFQPKRQ
ncbi:hypothetical protein [Actinobacillus equuli]|uniref:hypothetical protein n=1 Tax=Actinobacillus equuli TaxID=718 RepID=UPI002443333D|nr:hypothetical protein [Actinobacillus equuli]WGE79914.1 hypothetical protein NYR83_02955 [Actinobacillus equuli subsp. equuli]